MMLSTLQDTIHRSLTCTEKLCVYKEASDQENRFESISVNGSSRGNQKTAEERICGTNGFRYVWSESERESWMVRMKTETVMIHLQDEEPGGQ